MQNSEQNTSPDEASLVARCLGGDPTGFEDLVEQHSPRLKRLLGAMLNDPYDAEDVYQETLLRAFLNLDQLRLPSKFGAWIYTIAVNLARSWRTSYASTKLASLEELKSESSDTTLPNARNPSSETLLVQREESRQVHQAIDNLPPAEREAVLLVYLDGLSHQEAAEQLGATLSAVKVRIHRGKRHLRASFSDQVISQTEKQLTEAGMIDVKIHDVLIHFTEARNDLSAQVSDEQMKKTLSRMDQSKRYVVLLKEGNGERALPIWIGSFEAEAIVLSMKQAKIPRPLTFDLMKTLLELGDLRVTRIEINRLHETVFYANMIVKTRDGTSEIDCRPSDALNLAVRLEVPIFVAAEVMQANSQKPTQYGTYIINPNDPEMVWESLLNEAAT